MIYLYEKSSKNKFFVEIKIFFTFIQLEIMLYKN